MSTVERSSKEGPNTLSLLPTSVQFVTNKQSQKLGVIN